MIPTAPPLRLCALIPAFNLARTIGEAVQRTRRYLSDVWVIDDGSTDRTAEIAEDCGASVIRIPVNRGKGWALRCGFSQILSSGDFDAFITLDGDLQHDPADIPKLIDGHLRTGAEIVIGSRMSQSETIPRVRYWTNRVGVFCISWAAGQPLEDTQSGFRLYSRRVLETVSLRTTRYDTETELIIKAGLQGMKIICVPIRTIYHSGEDDVSHYRPFTDTFHISMVFLKSLFWRRGIPL
ncbi:MAG: glycosyltransferase family 2 protein [Syntrophobacteraceae bacterium]